MLGRCRRDGIEDAQTPCAAALCLPQPLLPKPRRRCRTRGRQLLPQGEYQGTPCDATFPGKEEGRGRIPSARGGRDMRKTAAPCYILRGSQRGVPALPAPCPVHRQGPACSRSCTRARRGGAHRGAEARWPRQPGARIPNAGVAARCASRARISRLSPSWPTGAFWRPTSTSMRSTISIRVRPAPPRLASGGSSGISAVAATTWWWTWSPPLALHRAPLLPERHSPARRLRHAGPCPRGSCSTFRYPTRSTSISWRRSTASRSGWAPPAVGRLQLTPIHYPPADEAVVESFALQQHLAPERPLVAIHLGADDVPAGPRWPTERFAQLADALITSMACRWSSPAPRKRPPRSRALRAMHHEAVDASGHLNIPSWPA